MLGGLGFKVYDLDPSACTILAGFGALEFML